MSFEPLLFLVMALLISVPVVIWLVRHFSAESRLERRRRRSNTRVTSKRKGPMIKFSVRAPKEKE
jgi:hypothetical protein